MTLNYFSELRKRNKSQKYSIARIVYVALFLISAMQSYAQDWEKTFGGSATEYGTAVQQTTDSGFIITGSTWSFGGGSEDVYLIKTDVNGILVWTKTFGGNFSDRGITVLQTYDGGYIIGGETTSMGAGGEDIYLIKTDSSGNLSWSKTFGSSGQEWGGSLIQTLDSGYALIGSSSNGFADVFLNKTNVSGDSLWTKHYGGTSNDFGYSLQQTSDDGFILSCATYDTSEMKYNGYVIKTDNAGDTLWTHSVIENSSVYFNSVALCSDGGFVIGGIANENFYSIKFDSLGSVQWKKEVIEINAGGLDRCFSIVQTNDDGFAMAGYQNNFGPADPDLLILKLDVNGNYLWSKKYGGNGDEEGSMIQTLISGGFIIVGKTSGFGAGDWQVYLIKTGCENFPMVSISAGDTTCQGNLISNTILSNTISGINYQWFRNDTLIPGFVSPSISATDDGNYYLIVSDSAGCSNKSNSIDIYFPLPAFSPYPAEVCPGDSVLMGWSFGQQNYSNYVWDFGDGTSDTGIILNHAYQDTGTFYITRSVLTTNGSCHTYLDSVRITSTAIPPVDFDLLINSNNLSINVACPGDRIDFLTYVYTYLFVPLPPFDAASYFWDFGDGTTDTVQHPVHYYNQNGNYTIKFTVTNSCGNVNSDSTTILIDSLSNSNIYFIWTDTAGVSGGSVNACESILFTSSGGVSYHWDFGDGTTLNTISDTVIHVYNSAGIFNVLITAVNGCGSSDTITHTIHVDGTCTGITSPNWPETADISIYPNPFNNSFSLKIFNVEKFENMEFKIYDLTGREILKSKIQNSETEIIRKNLPDGMYLFILSDGQNIIAKRKLIAQ